MNLKRLGLGLGVVLLLLLVGGAGCWWWLHRATANVAEYLPGETVLFVQIPDATATRQAYEVSHLKKVLQSPELGNLWSLLWTEASTQVKPEDKANLEKASQVWDLFARNLTGEAFCAVTAVDFEDPSKVGLVAGLRPKQGLGDIAPLVERLKKEGAEPLKTAKTGKATHDGVDYEWWEMNGKVKICLAAVGPWEILTVGEPALFDFIDRQHKKAASASLSQNASFKEVCSRMKGRQDALVYLGFDSLQTKLTKLFESNENLKKSSLGLKKIYEQIHGFGWGLKFEDGRIRESIVSLMPKATRADLGKFYEPCAFKSLAMTGPQTYLYVGQSVDAPKYWNYLLSLYKETAPELAQSLEQAPALATAQGLDFSKNVLAPLGNEMALLIDWPGDSLFPDVAIVVDVANPGDLKPTIDVLLKNLDAMVSAGMAQVTVTDSKVGDYNLKVVHPKQAPMISPTMITSGDKFGLFLTETGAKRLLDRKGAPSLAKEKGFTELGGDDLSGVNSVAYVNVGGLVEHAYQTAKPYVGLAAMMSPEMQKLVGSGKLPDKLSFVGDLGGVLMRTRVDDSGTTMLCISNAGNLPIVAGFLSGVGVAAFQNMNKKGENFASKSVKMKTADGEPTADGVKAELEELRAVIDAYAVSQDVPKGTAVTWTSISSYLVPGSPLQKNGGKDCLGNPYILGVIGEIPADVAPETKAKFSTQDASFWNPASTAAPASAPAEAAPAPAGN